MLRCGRSLTALMMTDVGVLTLNENPSFFAPFTRAPSSAKRKTTSEKAQEKTCTSITRWKQSLTGTDHIIIKRANRIIFILIIETNEGFSFLQFFLGCFLQEENIIRARKNVPSGHLGQVGFPARQETFLSHSLREVLYQLNKKEYDIRFAQGWAELCRTWWGSLINYFVRIAGVSLWHDSVAHC